MSGRFFKNFSFFSATISFFILMGIFTVLFLYARDSIKEFGLNFITSDRWQVGEDDEGGIFGGLIPIAGTLYTTFIAMIVATPIAMGIAIFLTEVAPSFLIKPISICIELLAAIPSIIYGMWGLFYFAPIVQNIFGGSAMGLLTASLVLAIMIIPFMSALTKDAMNTTAEL